MTVAELAVSVILCGVEDARTIKTRNLEIWDLILIPRYFIPFVLWIKGAFIQSDLNV